MEITATRIKELREQTGAGVLDCKKALEANSGDFEKAIAYLKEKGLAAVAKRADREVPEGVIGFYVHPGSRVAGLVEVNCETDFVARTGEFQQLAKDLAMHVVAMAPRYLSPEDIPAEVLEEKRRAAISEVEGNKPADVVEKIVQGKLEKFYNEVCLLRQAFIKDETMTIQDLVSQVAARVGENTRIRRFIRYEVGEEL